VRLYGIHFDTDSATIRNESKPTWLETENKGQDCSW
jgi:hypothetical protein